MLKWKISNANDNGEAQDQGQISNKIEKYSNQVRVKRPREKVESAETLKNKKVKVKLKE